MAPKDITQAKCPDLRGSLAAMQRASEFARQHAIDTNTGIVLVVDGKLTFLGADALRKEMKSTDAPSK